VDVHGFFACMGTKIEIRASGAVALAVGFGAHAIAAAVRVSHPPRSMATMVWFSILQLLPLLFLPLLWRSVEIAPLPWHRQSGHDP